MYALVFEDGWTGSLEIVAESKSRNKLIKMMKQYIAEGHNECLVNVIELEDE
jgi:hypothetical protein